MVSINNEELPSLLRGIQPHLTKHHCCWCEIDPKHYSAIQVSRTFGSLKTDHNKFIAAGSNENESSKERERSLFDHG